MSKRLTLAEDDVTLDDVVLTLPEDDIVIPNVPEELPVEPVEEPVVTEVAPEVVTSAYTDMLQDLLRKQWDVINSADSIIATIDSESAEVNKEDVKAILGKLVEDTTVAIGMVTKALGVVDPSQEELMNQGVAKAEEVISSEPVTESVEQPLMEDNSSAWNTVSFENDPYYERFWEEECFYHLQYLWENAEEYEDDENIQWLDELSSQEIYDICHSAAEEVRDSDYLWEEISERVQDDTEAALADYVSTLRNTSTVNINLGDLINSEENIKGE